MSRNNDVFDLGKIKTINAICYTWYFLFINHYSLRAGDSIHRPLCTIIVNINYIISSRPLLKELTFRNLIGIWSANHPNFMVFKCGDVVPTSNIWYFLRLANHLRKNTRPLLFRFIVGIFNSILEFTSKHRPHRPDCPTEEYRWSDCVEVKSGVGVMIWMNCAQIVPVKVKYFQTVPNETKS